jgi:hypothetical protein
MQAALASLLLACSTRRAEAGQRVKGQGGTSGCALTGGTGFLCLSQGHELLQLLLHPLQLSKHLHRIATSTCTATRCVA